MDTTNKIRFIKLIRAIAYKNVRHISLADGKAAVENPEEALEYIDKHGNLEGFWEDMNKSESRRFVRDYAIRHIMGPNETLLDVFELAIRNAHGEALHHIRATIHELGAGCAVCKL